LPAVAPRIPQGRGIAGGSGRSFADLFDKLPDNLSAITQEEGLAGLLAALTSAPDGVLPKSGETTLLESLLKDSSQLDPELRNAMELCLQVGTELPVAVAPQGATELPVAVVPQGATELPVTAAPQGVAGTLGATVLVGAMAVSPVIQREDMANATAKELPKVADSDNASSGAVIPKVETGQRQNQASSEAPALLDNLLEKMLGQAIPGRRQMASSRNELSEQGLRQELPFDPSIKAGPEVKPITAEAAAPGSVHQAIASLLQPGNDSAVLVSERPAVEAVTETGVQGGQALAARQAAMPEPIAAPGTGLRLSSGFLVPEEQLVDQVVGRLSIGRGRESSSMTMKLHPEELGEIRLSLLVEKETVKAQLVVQSQQIQEVLDRHMPKLRDALAQQGLKLEDVQVSVDSRQGDGHKGLFQDQHQHQPSTPFRFAVQRGAGNELTVQLGQGPMKSGLSIRI